MTRKDFELIARAMLAVRPHAQLAENKQAQHYSDCKALANACLAQNTRFDTGRFLLACGWTKDANGNEVYA
jgi:hypothetical protein